MSYFIDDILRMGHIYIFIDPICIFIHKGGHSQAIKNAHWLHWEVTTAAAVILKYPLVFPGVWLVLHSLHGTAEGQTFTHIILLAPVIIDTNDSDTEPTVRWGG